MRHAWLVVLLVACESTSAPAGDTPDDPPEDPTPTQEPTPPAMHLNVPAELIHEARRESTGLYQLTPVLRAQTMATRREEPAPSYAELREDVEAHVRERVSFTGRVGLVRSAGPRLWIMALHTRQEGEAWRDPLYVLAVIPPLIEPDGGVVATIDGWVVGERTIGQNTLPLVVAYYIEHDDEG